MLVVVLVHGVAARLMVGGTSPKTLNSKPIHWRFRPQITLLPPLVVVTKLVTVLELEEDELEESLLPPQENKPMVVKVASAISATRFLVKLKFIRAPFR